MRKKFLKWYRGKRFITAYRILRDEAKRHSDAGHNVHFLAVNESYLELRCYACPNFDQTFDVGLKGK